MTAELLSNYFKATAYSLYMPSFSVPLVGLLGSLAYLAYLASRCPRKIVRPGLVISSGSSSSLNNTLRLHFILEGSWDLDVAFHISQFYENHFGARSSLILLLMKPGGRCLLQLRVEHPESES